MEDSTIVGLLFIAIGIVTMVGAALNWYIVSHPGKLINRILGNTTARIIYFIVGIFLFVIGVGRLIGANWF